MQGEPKQGCIKAKDIFCHQSDARTDDILNQSSLWALIRDLGYKYAKSFSSSKINEVYPKNSDEKNSYNFNPNFTAPKSPRNKKKATAEESSGILHGRRGTNTFYPDS